jgi:hypothetical protein
MSDTFTLPPGAELIRSPSRPPETEASGGLSLPPGAELIRSPELSADDTKTTAGGLAASAARGLAPYAAGAALGAGAGSLLGGVGAIPGAVAGAGAVALSDLAGAAYNPIAKMTGLPAMGRMRDVTDAGLDVLGTERPDTSTERMVEAASTGTANALSGVGAARQLGQTLASPVARGVAARLAEQPELQALSGALGAVGGQGAAEAGVGPWGQLGFAALAGASPFVATMMRGIMATKPRPGVLEAREAGYVLPPAAISEKPSLAARMLAGWSGKIKTQQAASSHNQDVTNRLAATALGLPEETPLTGSVYQDVRAGAGQAYQAVTESIPLIRSDRSYAADIAALSGKNSQAAKVFPGIVRNQAISDLATELRRVPEFPTEAGIEIVKQLRFNGNANLKAIGDPSKHALGLAQREAANAIDDLIERNITVAGHPEIIEAYRILKELRFNGKANLKAIGDPNKHALGLTQRETAKVLDALIERNIAVAGQPEIIKAYRSARQLIAKSYDLEGATNPATGDINARGLARLSQKGKPLTGELQIIANVANAFPKTVQSPPMFGHDEAWSALDFFGGATAAVHGHPGIGAAIMGRPAARAVLLSKAVQDAMTNQRRGMVPLPMLTQPGWTGIVPPVSPDQRPRRGIAP